MIKRCSLVIIAGLLLFIPVLAAHADTPTPTPTPTTTSTYIPTIAPPPMCDDYYNPCTNLPWAVPVWPTLALPSPTIINIYMEPSPTSIPGTASPSPTPSATVIVDTSGVSTMNSVLEGARQTLMSQSTQQVSIAGTPMAVANTANTLGQYIGQFFAYVNGYRLADFGKTGGVITFAMLALAFIVLVKLAIFAGPILIGIIKIILMAIQALKPW